MSIEIKNRWTGEVIEVVDAETLQNMDLRDKHWNGADLSDLRLDGARLDGARLDGARLDGARLDGARLDGASLVGASLVGASLVGASLVRANLVRANLVRANLVGANLDGARLDGARLDGARLDGARLDGARLDGANLDGANLDGARLDGARLDGANLDPIKHDMWIVLLDAVHEIPALKQALINGQVSGSTYTGECCCLVGTIAKTRGVDYHDLGIANAVRPIERFFLAIQEGDTPENSQFAKLALEWAEEFEAKIAVACGAPSGT